MDIHIAVNGQKMEMPVPAPVIIDGSRKFVKLAFDLSNDWDTMTIYCQFQQRGHAWNKYLDDLDRTVYLPEELKDGAFDIMLCGAYGDSIATSSGIQLFIEGNRLEEDEECANITPSLYSQLIKKMDDHLGYDVLSAVEGLTTEVELVDDASMAAVVFDGDSHKFTFKIPRFRLTDEDKAAVYADILAKYPVLDEVSV